MFEVINTPTPSAYKALYDQTAVTQIIPKLPVEPDQAYRVLELYVEGTLIAQGPTYTGLSEHLLFLIDNNPHDEE